jgi:hypothetical protein
VDGRIEIPHEQLLLRCSCGGYTSSKPGDTSGISQHIRRSRCGGSWVAVLPEDLVLQDEIDAEPAWAADVPLPGAEPPASGESAPAPSGRGQVAQGKVVPPADGGPTRFRGTAAAPAALYAAYDALRTQASLEGSFDDWLVECTSLYLEGLGFNLTLVAGTA